jgi:hypothetical protein
MSRVVLANLSLLFLPGGQWGEVVDELGEHAQLIELGAGDRGTVGGEPALAWPSLVSSLS